MNNLFSDILDICIVIYLDNILIYSNNMFELKYLWKADLYAKAEKQKFYFELVEYLEYIFSSSNLTMSDDKVKNIQFFLGFANFYC